MILKHEHIIIRAEVAEPPTTAAETKKWVTDLVPKINMKLMGEPQAYYSNMTGNQGATCVAVIETSHIAMHVWDADRPSLIQLDVYSCKELDIDVVLSHLKQFEPVKIEYKFLDREKNLVIVPDFASHFKTTKELLMDVHAV